MKKWIFLCEEEIAHPFIYHQLSQLSVDIQNGLIKGTSRGPEPLHSHLNGY